MPGQHRLAMRIQPLAELVEPGFQGRLVGEVGEGEPIEA